MWHDGGTQMVESHRPAIWSQRGRTAVGSIAAVKVVEAERALRGGKRISLEIYSEVTAAISETRLRSSSS
jgi:hypothetical protein